MRADLSLEVGNTIRVTPLKVGQFITALYALVVALIAFAATVGMRSLANKINLAFAVDDVRELRNIVGPSRARAACPFSPVHGELIITRRLEQRTVPGGNVSGVRNRRYLTGLSE